MYFTIVAIVFRLLNNSYTLNYKCKSFIKLTPDSKIQRYIQPDILGGGEGRGGGANELQGLEQKWRLN